MKLIISSLQVSINGSKGHLNPAIEIALAAKKRGHKVAILPLPSPLSRNEEYQLERLGIRYIEPPKLPNNILKSREELATLATNPEQTHLAYKAFMLDPLPYQLSKIKEIFVAEEPDAVISDLLVYGSTLIANDLEVQDFGYCAGLKLLAKENLLSRYADISSKLHTQFQDVLDNFPFGLQRHHLELLASKKNFVFFPKEYDFIFRDDKEIVFAGSLCHSDRGETADDIFELPEEPFAILSFGSALDPYDFPDVTNKFVEATKRLGIKLLIGSSKMAQREYDTHVRCYSYLPMKILLKKATVYFHHGGANSFSEALSSGVPQVLVPLTTDQPIQGEVLNQLKCGLTVNPDELKVETIEKFVVNRISDKEFQFRLKNVKNEFSGSGPNYIVKTIENERYLKNIYSEKREISEVIYPNSVAEVQNLVLLANKEKKKIHPVSSGKNYGLGSQLPAYNIDYVLDLKELNSISNYDELAGTIRVEAGVTQKQLYEYLTGINAHHVLDVTGSSEDSSIIGNALERGIAHYGCRVSSIVSMKVVLGDGNILDCGGDSVDKSNSSTSYPYGLGPDLKGLFFQSSFGVVVEATIFLRPKRPDTVVISGGKRSNVSVEDFIDRLTELRKKGLLPANMHISNKNRKVSVVGALYQNHSGLTKNQVDEVINSLSSDLYFTCSMPVDNRLRLSIENILIEELANIVDIDFTDINAFAQSDKSPLKGVFEHSLGVPSDDALRSLGFSLGKSINPKYITESGMGTFFLAPILPFKGKDVAKVLALITKSFAEKKFQLFATFNAVESNNLEGVLNLVFDKNDNLRRREAKRAMLKSFNDLNNLGYLPQRMSIFQSPEFYGYNKSHKEAANKIKDIFDPNGVISPNRYGLQNE